MSLEIRNSADLIKPENLKFKVLIYSPPGGGKTTFASTAPNPGIAACETGQGKGIVSVADRNLDYVEPSSYQEIDQFCSGGLFRDKETLVVDSLTEMTRTFIKDYALSQVSRKHGDSEKRALGIPELDDYMAMAELTRRLMRKLLDQPKHIVVTAVEAGYEPPVIDMKHPDRNRAERIGGPDLPGVMRVAAPAMFDIVLRLVVRPRLLDNNNPKSRVNERFILTELDDKHAGKNRIVIAGKSVFPPEVPFNLDTGSGTFGWFLNRFIEAQAKKSTEQSRS